MIPRRACDLAFVSSLGDDSHVHCRRLNQTPVRRMHMKKHSDGTSRSVQAYLTELTYCLTFVYKSQSC